LLHILGYSFCVERHVLAYFCQVLLLPNVSRIVCAKAVINWRQNVGEIKPKIISHKTGFFLAKQQQTNFMLIDWNWLSLHITPSTLG
jgi:hypothetical protein